jgi:hypothetical protein
MKKFLSYILRSYCWTVIAITIETLITTVIMYYCDSSYDKNTPFSSPIFISIVCGIIVPINNLTVILALYKYRFTKTEIVIESICFMYVSAYMDDIIRYLVSPSQLWHHEVISGNDNYTIVWWYNSSFNIVYGICLTIILCLLYIKIKQFVTKQINKKNSL